jgi:hypothetical protein
MSDAPQTTGEQADPTLTARRIAAFVIAFALGLGTVGLGMIFVLKTTLGATVPLSFLELPLLPLAGLPLGFFFLIWVDYFMHTKLIPD